MKPGGEMKCERCQTTFIVGTVYDFPTYLSTWHLCPDGIRYQIAVEKGKRKRSFNGGV